MQKNRLALVESLFNYPNLSLKEKILKNYEDGEYGGNEEMQQNMFVDKDEDEWAIILFVVALFILIGQLIHWKQLNLFIFILSFIFMQDNCK